MRSDAIEGAAFVATPAQATFFDAVFSGRYRFLAYGGGIRSGKSATAIILVQLLCRIFPGSRWAIVRMDLPTLRRNVLPTFEKFRIPGFMGPVNHSDWTATAVNGSQVVFFTESISEDPDLNRWRGLEVNGFFLEEANELQEQSFNKAIERAGSWVLPPGREQPPPLVVCTFNPSGGWVKRKFYDPARAGTLAAPWYFQPATIADNPHLPAEYVESLRSMPERDYKRFVEGDWTFISGAFFDELGADTHLVQPLDAWPDYWTYWGGYDWGFRHPAVYMSFAKDTGGQQYLLDTIRMHRMDDDAQARMIAEKSHPKARRLVFAGHDALAKRMAHQATTESVRDVFARHKIGLVPAYLNRIPGWATTRRLLTRKQADGTVGTPDLLIVDTPGNRWAVERLLELTPDPTDPEDVLKVDANEDGEGGDDVGDCLRYGCCQTGLPKAPSKPQEKQEDRGAPWTFGPDGRVTTKTKAPTLDTLLRGGGERGPRVPSRNWRKG